MEDLLANQNQLMEAIDQLMANFRKDGGERKTPAYIKKRLDTLDLYWQEFQTNHINLCSSEDKNHIYYADNYYQKTKKYYEESRIKIQHYSNTIPKKEEFVLKPATFTEVQKVGETSSDQSGRNQTLPTPKTSQGIGSKLEEMLRKQSSNFKAFSRTINNVDLETISEKWEFEDTLKTIHSRWAAIDSLHWQIDSELYEDNMDYENSFSKYEMQYNNIKKLINSKMWAVSHRETSTPRMDIPTFSGNYHQWISFKDLFQESIHNNKSISNAQKMQFLKSKLRGEAEKLIQHLHISTENYQVCWDILNHRYNNTKLIFSSHINILLSLPTIQQQSAASIKKIHDTTNECLNSIKNLGVDISTWDPLVVHILAQKLDSETHNDYIESLKNPRELPTLSEFIEFLENKFTSLESSRRKQDTSKTTQQTNQQDTSPGKKAHFQKPISNLSWKKPFNNYSTIKNYNTSIQKCPVCSNNHGLFHCKMFLESKPEAKRKTVAQLNLCKNCLYDHNGQQCISQKRCRQCQGNHNTLLHDTYATTASDLTTSSTSTAQNSRKNVTHVSQDNIAEILLATAQIKVRSVDGTYLNMRALIDQGSQTSLITENAAQQLGLPRQRSRGVVFGVGTKENNCKGKLKITISAMHSDFTINTDVLIMRSLINNLPNQSFQKPSWPYLEGIQLADPTFNISRPIDLLLGADIYPTIILSGMIREVDSLPIAQQTRFGWILCGNVKSYQCNVIINNIDEIQKFWAIEDIADNPDNLSTEDQHCMEQFKSETKRHEDGRYIVRLPVKPEIREKLGESRSKAVAQFHQLEKKFIKHDNIAINYKTFMNEYIQLGHMRECERNKTPPLHCYLPHHCVQRPDSSTTALRVVFNGSAKTSSGYSLNDLMYSGPNLQQDLFSLIIKWRQYKYAFTADIEKMFRQILCHEDDQHYQKIIWRESIDQLLSEYVLTTVTYGTKAAPFLAMMTLKQLAIDEFHKYPEAAKVLSEDFYMDDVVTGSHDIRFIKQLQADLTALLKLGGFNLRKWTANKPELMENVSKENNSNQQAFDFKHQESAKALGLRWHPHYDQFTIELKINASSSSKSATKRSLLSEISKVFDPLGWLSPVTAKLKLLFQKVWSLELQWDDYLPEHIKAEWSLIKQDLQYINHIKIQRWLEIHENDVIELHGFSDASIRAYACVIYCKINKQHEKQPSSVVLVAAKTRLVPLNKNVSLPRLELCAALLLSRLIKTVQQCWPAHTIKIHGWSDSTAVLGWLQGDPKRWKPFVANRVEQITTTIPSDCWRYVKSGDNPADCASRGLSVEQLKQHTLWWSGPTWLPTLQADSEAKEHPLYVTNEEIKKSVQSNITTLQNHDNIIGDILNKYSWLARATRVIAWVLRVAARGEYKQSYLTINELRRAKNMLIKYQQQLDFSEDIDSLKKHSKVESKSKLLNLTPFLDEDGLLRVGGRLKNANINQSMKHPLIIPHSSHLTSLLIDEAHKTTFHGGPRLTLASLRQQYWIIGGNRAVKKRLRTCVRCRRNDPVKQHQIMGDLPAARCNPTRPFYHTGVDYTGYVDVKFNKGRGAKTTKGYIAVFVCMVTKAVHLEIVSDLSSSAFLAALRRMAARRGAPHHIYSDNGTNFVGANRCLQKEFIDLQNTLDHDFFSAISDMKIQWSFTAPSWPSSGGLWESAVKSLKHHLRRVVGEQKLTFEEFTTLLAQLEACLNARPLCALSEDPEDIEYLTPSHFLASGPTLTIIETERDERTRWQLTQKIFNDIWKRWRTEYLSQLSTRSKWRQPQTNLKIEDIVIIDEANMPAGKWALGRVVEVHPGKDGYVRVASVKTKNGIIKRPIVKLSVLPINDTWHNEGNQKDKQNVQQNDIAPERPISNNNMKRSRQKRSCNLLAMTLLLCIAIITPVQCTYNLLSLQNNQSIYLDKVTSMRLVRDEWKLIVYYDMNPYWEGSTLLLKYINNLENICMKSNRKSQCDIVILQLRHGYTELDHYNRMLLGQQFYTRTRQRRGLINGVGYVAHSLFGVLDEQFAEQYQQDIELLRKNQKHLALLWRNQTSVVEAEYNLIKRVEDVIDKQHKIYNQHLNELETAASTLNNEIKNIEDITDFTLSSIIANSILVNLKNIQNTLLDTVTNIQYGKFNIHLLTPEQLRDELNIISGQIAKDLSIPIENIQTDLSKLYHLLQVRARMTKQFFIFEIKVPLMGRDNYKIYKIIAIPQQIDNNMMRSIIPIADHVAINIQKDSYLPITEGELQRCLQYDTDIQLCPLQRPIYHMKSDNSLCIKDQASNQCKVNTMTCTSTWTRLTKTNTHLFFCCDQCTVRILCEHQVTAERLTKAGIITSSSDCVIKGEAFTIISHKLQNNEINTQPDVIKIEVPSINNVINLSIPIHRLEVEDESNQKYLKDIKDGINQMKASESEGILEDRMSYHDVHHYAVIYCLVAAAGLAGALYAWRQWRARRSLSVQLPRAVALAASVDCERRVSVQYSKKAEQTSIPRRDHDETTPSGKEQVLSARVLDKATSPIFRNHFSK